MEHQPLLLFFSLLFDTQLNQGQCRRGDGAGRVVLISDGVIRAAVTVIHRDAGDRHGLVAAGVGIEKGEAAAGETVAAIQRAGGERSGSRRAGVAVVGFNDIAGADGQRLPGQKRCGLDGRHLQVPGHVRRRDRTWDG